MAEQLERPPDSTVGRPQGRIRGLDGMRGVAVLLVILFHAQALLGPDSPQIRFIAGGWSGVDIFFVVSGFLITGILRKTSDHPRYWRTFAIRRALRILPLYFLVLFMVILPRVLVGEFEGPPYWIYPIFISNFWIASSRSVVALDVTWSLSIEEQFYVFWPLVVRFTSLRRFTWICVALVVAAPIVRYFLHDPTNEVSYMWTQCRIDSLAWGALAWIAWEQGSASWCRWASRLAPVGTLAWVVLLAVGGDVRTSLTFAVVGYTAFPIVVAAVVLGLASGRLQRSIRVLEWSPLAHFGKVSFGAYLLHGVVINMLGTILLGHPVIGMVAVTLLTWAIATLVWRTVESPILAKKDELAPY